MHGRHQSRRAAMAVRTRWAVSIVDEKRIIRPETGDVHFLAYIAAFVGSCCSIWLAASRMDPPILLIVALFMRMVIFAFAIPFAWAALGVWVTGRMIPEWHLRRPVLGSACAAIISSVGTLLFVSISLTQYGPIVVVCLLAALVVLFGGSRGIIVLFCTLGFAVLCGGIGLWVADATHTPGTHPREPFDPLLLLLLGVAVGCFLGIGLSRVILGRMSERENVQRVKHDGSPRTVNDV